MFSLKSSSSTSFNPDFPQRPVLEACKELVQRIARLYYEPKYIIILDLLSKNNSLKDEELSKAMKMQAVDVRKLCVKLRDDGMIRIESKTEEIKEYRHTKKVSRTHCYIDYRYFVAVIKYKMMKMQQAIMKEVETKNNNLCYICNLCQLKYDPLTAMKMIRPEDGMFVCEICNFTLEKEKSMDIENDLSMKFNTESKPILDLLRETDAQEIPEFDKGATTVTGKATTDGPELMVSKEGGAQAQKIMVQLEGFGEDLSNGTPKSEPLENDDGVSEYYAKLAAQSVNNLAQGTATGSYDYLNGGFGSTESLKRERGDEDAGAVKKARVEEDSDDEDEEFVEV
ncbi:hypothetical protein HDV05_007271 [Chytridiales sp. JEL 0842]|nr:hypothetical protein HDV05_007271 [Chytridiales sp. JEL 0842]